MLSQSNLQTIVLTSNLTQAEEFYGNVLGLSLKRHSDGTSIFDVNGSDLTLAPVPDHTPSEHTVIGFSVPDVDEIVATLIKKEIELVRFKGFPHDASGVLRTPDGARVVWIRDPDRNLLSMVQFPKGA